MKSCTALIVAAGRGSRFGGELPKQYCSLSDGTVIGATLMAFANHSGVSAISVVIHPDDLDLYTKSIDSLPSIGSTVLLRPVFGGSSRQESVFNGLENLANMAETTPELVLIHDAARPFVSKDVIDRVLASLCQNAAVIPALAVNDTLKRKEGNAITGTVDRSELVRAQTPQGFRFKDILQAHRSARNTPPQSEMTDDAAVAEHAGLDVNIVEGSEENVKITSQQDLQQAEQALASRRNMNNRKTETRTGTGFDVHRFVEGDGVTLCGILVPYSSALAGHSDADVALHALTDALLGAVGKGDIGEYFPPTDPQWKGVASDVFLKKACQVVAELSARIVNVDVTIICESPKIEPHRESFRQNVASILQIDVNRVNIKATTTEKLGFTGRSEGIAVQAVASVEIPRN